MASPSSNLTSNQTAEECPAIDNLAWYDSYLTKDVLAGLVALISLNTIAGILAVLLNVLVILAVVRNAHMRSNSKILLACLAGNDLVTAVFVQPLQIARDIRHVLGKGTYCVFDCVSVSAVIFSCLTSLSHVAVVTIDRYIAIKYPLQYRSIVTRQRLILGVLTAWAVPLAFTIVPAALGHLGGKQMLAVLFFVEKVTTFSKLLSLGGVVYMNAAILVESRRRRKRLACLQNEVTRQVETKKLKKKDRVAKTVAIVVSILVLSYVPSFTLVAFVERITKVVPKRVMYVLSTTAITVLQLNTFLNPLIYGWRMKEFREAFFEILPSCH